VQTISGLSELTAMTGGELGVSAWHEVTQRELDGFAAATGDTYWLHTDPARAAATEVGSTIAHGLLTLSLGPMLTDDVVAFEGWSMRMNYGYERVRFTAPLPVGSRVRLRLRLEGVDVLDGGARATLAQTFEREDHEKPVCVAQFLLRLFD
jgi:acyl dehydratase